MPIATSILDVVEAIKKQITDKAVGMSGTASPQAQEPPQQLTPEPPPDVDYTAGMQRPDISTLASNMQFKATPSRASAMLVALGNILQDKRNVEAAKQAAQQSDYDAKLGSAMDLNKARSGMQMKREFDESDPDVLMGRKLKQGEIDMLPLKEKGLMADLLFKTKRASKYGEGGGSRGGSGVGGNYAAGLTGGTIDEEIENAAWDYSQKNNVPIEDARIAIANDKLSRTYRNPNMAAALKNIIKQNTFDPIKEELLLQRKALNDEKLKALREPDAVKQASKLQNLRLKEGNLKALEEDYGFEVPAAEDIVNTYAPEKAKTTNKPYIDELRSKALGGKK